MTRVLMIISPSKRSTYEKMAEEFSPRLEVSLCTPAYPSPDYSMAPSRSVTMRHKLLGDVVIGEIMRDFEPDAIFTDSALYAMHARIWQLRVRKGAPILLHLLGDWWSEYWSWFYSTNWRRRILGSQQFVYDWGGLALAREILPVCKWLERVTKQHFPRKNTKVIHMGVDPNEFHDLPGMRFEKPAVSIIQNHTVLPKVQGLLNFKQVTDRLPSVHFYIAEGQPVTQRYLAQVRSTFATSGNVHFVEGIHTVERVRMMLTASDCYVLASGLDCCPATVLEASLMCKPVLASRVGGVPEMIVENQTGWTIPNSSMNEWVDRISQLLSDENLRSRFGRAGRKWVSEKFAWSVITAQVEGLILNHVES
jgi:glycosyltransferase involved in cell wall biosynthesis